MSVAKPRTRRRARSCMRNVLLVYLLLVVSSQRRTVRALVSSSSNNNNNNGASVPVLTHGPNYCWAQLPSPLTGTTIPPPPLVVIVGMAQSINSYQQHLPFLLQAQRQLAKKNTQQDDSINATVSVLLYQPYGLGKDVIVNNINDDLSLPAQARRLVHTLQDTVWNTTTTTTTSSTRKTVSLAGFSLGGRIAMCTACLYPQLVHKVHVTGVALRPSLYAQVQYHAWKQQLQQALPPTTNDNKDDNDINNKDTTDNKHHQKTTLSSFAWSALLATYSPSFLWQHQSKLSSWVTHVQDTQTVMGLYQLLQQTHQSEWSVERLVQTYFQTQPLTPMPWTLHFCVGRHDRMAPVETVYEMARIITNTTTEQDDGHRSMVTVLNDCDHAVPMEAPRAWRQDIINFLKQDE